MKKQGIYIPYEVCHYLVQVNATRHVLNSIQSLSDFWGNFFFIQCVIPSFSAIFRLRSPAESSRTMWGTVKTSLVASSLCQFKPEIDCINPAMRFGGVVVVLFQAIN